MTKLRKYMVYLDGGNDCYKVAVPAKDKKEAVKYCVGNGEAVHVKDVTDECKIELFNVYKALSVSEDFSAQEIDFITRTLQMTGIAE